MISLLYRLGDWARHAARKRRWPADHALGRRAEDMAHRYLRRRGYQVVARNFRTVSGTAEADIIAWDGPTLVIAEVKSRGTDAFGPPDRAVDEEKRIQLERAARDYCRRSGTDFERVRFDIVNVVFSKPRKIELRKDVFRPERTV